MSKIRKGGLDQYGAGHFGRLIFCHNQKKCGTEMVNVIGQNPVTCHEA